MHMMMMTTTSTTTIMEIKARINVILQEDFNFQ
jgi:hypothetical protein